MGFNLIKKEDKINIETTFGLIYGYPSSGKTSLANTSGNCLTLDFDNGVHRSAYRKDVVQISSWTDISNDTKGFIELIKKYDVIIVDTISKCMESIEVNLIEKNPKFKRNKLQMYGQLKNEFKDFTNILRNQGKDLIMIAQVKEHTEGDMTIKRPAITGSSYSLIADNSDFIGYMQNIDKNRTLDFNPSEYFIGKNSMNFPTIILPNFTDEPDFFQTKLKEIKASLGNISNVQKETVDLIQKFRNKIDRIETPEECNSLVDELKDLSQAVKIQVRQIFKERVIELGFTYNKDKNVYEAVNKEPEPKVETEPDYSNMTGEKEAEELKPFEVEEPAEAFEF